MEQIIIKHLKGSKANQQESFSLEKHKEIILGRDPSSNVTFHPEIDDLVSRQHAKIEQDPVDKTKFIITDLNSRNGTLVNNEKLSGSREIKHGDVIQLGSKGPEFVFEIDPPPADFVHLTRVSESEQEMPGSKRASRNEKPTQSSDVAVTQPANVTGW